jgi:hypothetical protein
MLIPMRVGILWLFHKSTKGATGDEKKLQDAMEMDEWLDLELEVYQNEQDDKVQIDRLRL